jgi:lysozyme family protein
MAASNFDRVLTLVLKYEGGYVDHPKDPGGATNLGITLGTLSNWLGREATKAEVKALTVKDVSPIYREWYWFAVRGDELPAGVDCAVFDFGVNSGPSRAVMALQRAVGVADDGKLGPVTLKAVAAADPRRTIERICTDRLAFLRRLSTWPVFGKGWSKRVASVEREAIAMIEIPALPPPDIEPVGPVPAPPPSGGFFMVLAAPIQRLFRRSSCSMPSFNCSVSQAPCSSGSCPIRTSGSN